MPRFVILEHQFPAGHERAGHWDFMLEVGSVLKTWDLPRAPSMGDAIDAEQLPDHRLAYLEFEGAVSGDRGSVRQWDAGTYQAEMVDEHQWRVALYGGRISGRV